MAKSLLVTIMTDFGTRDPYVAQMKGVILSMCPRARLVDITHEISAHDVVAGAFMLVNAATYYPRGTLHVVVVDPGVGTERKIIAGRFGGQTFLFPDNGVISFVAEAMPLEEIVSVRNTKYLPSAGTSMTFHGRDIFAPIAAHILNGLDIRKLGPQPETYRLLDIQKPREEGEEIIGQVIYIDSFGNLITNISKQRVSQRWDDLSALKVTCPTAKFGEAIPLQGAYAFVHEGLTLALFNSMSLLEVAVNRGRACDVLGLAIGAEVRIGDK